MDWTLKDLDLPSEQRYAKDMILTGHDGLSGPNMYNEVS